MRHTRLYSDSDGSSHFEDVDVEVDSVDFAPPAPPLGVSTPVASSRLVFIQVPVGWVGDWHPAPKRQYWVQMSGDLQVEVTDGASRRFGPGDVVLLEDVTGRGHVTRSVGDADVWGVFVQLPD